MTNIEPDLATWWSGLRGWLAAHKWWLASLAGAFVLGALL
jgi:hypothetical protein